MANNRFNKQVSPKGYKMGGRTKKMTELRSSGYREGMREAFTKLQAETDKGLKAIFTDAQWVMYEKWKKENPPRRRGRGGN